MTLTDRIAFHLRFGDRQYIPSLKILMKTVLEPAGVTMIILELDKNFVFERHPEVNEGQGSLTREDASELQAFARNMGIEIVPLFQCLGHQGWGGSRSALLRAYPEFDETPDVALNAEWPEIFCRSWCPQHPKVNTVVFELLDELIAAFTPKYFHIGMDEVYEIASDQCDRCRGKDRAELFSMAVNDMYVHLAREKGLEVMMWGDRLLNAKIFGYDNWEADAFGTHKAIDSLPKDIIVLDWHYDEREKGFPTPLYLMKHGFRVMPACWFKGNVAEDLFSQAQSDAREHKVEDRFYGKLITTWHQWNEEAFADFKRYSDGDTDDSEVYRLFETLQNAETF